MLYPSMTPSRFVSDLSGIWDFATSQSLLRVQGNKQGNLHPRPQAETGGTLFPGEMASDSGF